MRHRTLLSAPPPVLAALAEGALSEAGIPFLRRGVDQGWSCESLALRDVLERPDLVVAEHDLERARGLLVELGLLDPRLSPSAGAGPGAGTPPG